MIHGRNNFTYVANIFTLLCSCLLIMTFEDGTFDFRMLTFIVVTLGGSTSAFYFSSINEPALTSSKVEQAESFLEN